MARSTLGDYLTEERPVGVLWDDMVEIVYRDSPAWARVERLAPSAFTVYAVGCFAGELNNGGFSQFFENSAGDRAHESLAALRAIGSVLCVQLLETALTIFPGGVAPANQDERIDLLHPFEEQNPDFLEELSQVYYKKVHPIASHVEEDLVALRLAFMQKHRGEPVEAFAAQHN